MYWLDDFGGTLLRVPKEGGELERLMVGADHMLWSTSLAVDDRCVYWAASDPGKAGGAIFKMAK